MWRRKALIIEMLREVFSTCEDVFTLPEPSLDVVSGSALLEGMVLQCLVHSNECCMKVCHKSGCVCLCFPDLFHHLLELWLLTTVSLSFVLQRFTDWVKLSYIAAVVSGGFPSVYHSDPLFLVPFEAETLSASLYFPAEILLQVTASPSRPKLIISTHLHYAMLL